MHKVAIVSAARTPIGNFGGSIKSISAAQLGEIAAKAAAEGKSLNKCVTDLLGEAIHCQ